MQPATPGKFGRCSGLESPRRSGCRLTIRRSPSFVRQTELRMVTLRVVGGLVLLLFAFRTPNVLGESGYDAWLRYAPIQGQKILRQYKQMPHLVVSTRD